MRILPARLCSLAFLAVLAAVGCGGGGATFVPVEGKVSIGGKTPLTKGDVTYVPDVEGGNNQKYSDFPRGLVDSEGKYTLSTVGTPGAPMGKYKVVVNPNAGFTPDSAKPVFPPDVIEKASTDSSTTQLRIEVKAGAPAGHYDLSVKPAK
ncbi:MAG: hypothetical protein ACRC33_16185 [Gemmataceae bacterium]